MIELWLSQLLGQCRQLFDTLAALAVHGDDQTALLLIPGHPFLEAFRIGQVRLVEDDDRRLLANELGNHGIGTAQRNARVDELNNHIDDLQVIFY